jgi:hypothetical protein
MDMSHVCLRIDTEIDLALIYTSKTRGIRRTYLKFGFKEFKDDCRDDPPDTTAINGENGDVLPISWGMNL